MLLIIASAAPWLLLRSDALLRGGGAGWMVELLRVGGFSMQWNQTA